MGEILRRSAESFRHRAGSKERTALARPTEFENGAKVPASLALWQSRAASRLKRN
jgi:hypothetical protein